jgi:hypothetical protein
MPWGAREEEGVVKISLALGSAVAVAAFVALARHVSVEAAPSSSAARLPPAAKAGESVFYGHVRSLVRSGNHFLLRVDPAWWLSGVTAQRAAVADKTIRPGEAVPNDYYIVDDGHRLLTYLVPANAHVTVLTNGTRTTAITATVLARVLRGAKTPLLSEPRAGYWLRAAGDTVRSLDQQYQP